MSQARFYPQSQRVLPSSENFARFQVTTNLLESVCLKCFKVLGTSSHIRGLAILEGAHRCPEVKSPGRRDKAAA